MAHEAACERHQKLNRFERFREAKEATGSAGGFSLLHISQRQLERLLGLSQGYLSRLRSGAGNPSPELVSHLALLAKDPSTRLSELQRYWAEPEACVVSPFAHDLHGNKLPG